MSALTGPGPNCGVGGLLGTQGAKNSVLRTASAAQSEVANALIAHPLESSERPDRSNTLEKIGQEIKKLEKEISEKEPGFARHGEEIEKLNDELKEIQTEININDAAIEAAKSSKNRTISGAPSNGKLSEIRKTHIEEKEKVLAECKKIEQELESELKKITKQKNELTKIFDLDEFKAQKVRLNELYVSKENLELTSAEDKPVESHLDIKTNSETDTNRVSDVLAQVDELMNTEFTYNGESYKVSTEASGSDPKKRYIKVTLQRQGEINIEYERVVVKGAGTEEGLKLKNVKRPTNQEKLNKGLKDLLQTKLNTLNSKALGG